MKGKRNILFTDDVETKDMKNIMLRTNPKLKLHEEYDIIKISHHGTEHHHFDFSNLCRKNRETLFWAFKKNFFVYHVKILDVRKNVRYNKDDIRNLIIQLR